ncbi:MAG: hypothetical protein NCW75_05185 [Phycisphaera sp.]|nr:MAG: hypothetical protein NCW75_05185 [Phycisphaera sp.]
MKVHDLRPAADMAVHTSPEWQDAVYPTVACNRCNGILRRFWEQPIDVDLDGSYSRGDSPGGRFARGLELWSQALWGSGKRGLSGPRVTVIGAQLMVLRNDLVEDLELNKRGFSLGSVSVDGIKQQDFSSVVAGRAARVMIQSDHITYRGTCSVCGRPGRGLDFNEPLWFEASTIEDKDVFSDEIGGTLYVTDKRLGLIRPSIVNELKVKEIEVRDQQGPDRMPE